MNIKQIGCAVVSGLAIGALVEFAGGNSVLAATPTESASTSAPIELAQATVCRRILPTRKMLETGGVLLRSKPSRSSAIAGVGYAPYEKFDTTRETAKAEGLIWLKVAGPRAGWIWAGNGNTITHIGNCL
ncbi:MAG: hypothetical protein HC866_02300 [Leptolyngbyaceae cyanobacterium RU_5_1]|nr:hypothetical protein [Leptolyngbyaceae cyanobacterium RU_5_1]